MVFDAVTEMLIGGVWTTADVYERDGITVVRGRSDEASSAEPSRCSLTLDNRTGNYSPRNPTGAYYGQIGRNTPLRVRKPSADPNYLALPGDFPSYASTPDAAALDITGDIDIRIDLEPFTWRPVNQYGLARKYVDDDGAFNNQGSWVLDLRADGTLRFVWTTAGFFSGSLDSASTVAIPSSSTRLAVRVTMDVDNGAAGRDIKFWTSTTGVTGTWTQLGATVTQAGTTSIFNSNSAVEVGRTVDGSAAQGDIPPAVQGKVYAFQLRSGIGGTVVANPDFTGRDSGTTEFTDSAGSVWTLQGSAAMVNASARFHGEISSLPVLWDKPGRDVYAPVEAFGVMRRLSQGATALKSVIYRLMTTDATLVAYWPCEDADGAEEFASGIPGGLPMLHPSGDTTNATYDQFKASEALPEASGVQWTGQAPASAATGVVQVGFLMRVPTGGVASTAEVCRARTTGTAPLWTLSVNTGGDLRLQAFDNEDVQIVDSGFITSPAVNGKRLRVTVTLEQSGADIDWSVCTMEVGVSSSNIFSGTRTGRTVGRVSRVAMNAGGVMTDTVLGHVTVRDAAPFVNDMTSDELVAYKGETATARVLRLCQEEGVPVVVTGDVTDAALMGPQLPGKLADLLRECEASDMGILYEPRGFLGLAYRTRVSLYSQPAALTLDYTARTLQSVEPVEDDDATRNDVTVTRVLGSSARAELTEGALSVLAPPNGVGRYDEEVEISLSRNEELQNQATWRLHLGTVDEARYPVLGIDLAMPAYTSAAGLTADTLALDVGDKVVVTNVPAWLPPDDVRQLVQGYTETISTFNWVTDFACFPGGPWDVGVWDDSSGPGEARYSSDGTTLVAGAALLLDGVSPGRGSTPDTAALDITGDIDLRVYVAMDDWTPAAAMALMTKSTTTGNQISWRFNVLATGILRLVWSADGSTTLSADSTVAPTISNGGALWVRSTLDVDNGAAGRDIVFYTSTDGSVWTQLGTTVTQAGVTSIFNSTAPVVVGSRDVGTLDRLAGSVFAVRVRNGIAGSVVANPDFDAQVPGTASFVDGTGKTWTITTPGVLSGSEIVVDTPTGPVWGVADLPYDIMIGGERMTVTAVVGTGTDQTFAVTRAVNGVVKAQPAGSDVALFKPAYAAL